MKTDILSTCKVTLIEKRQFYDFLKLLMQEVREAQLTELEYELSGVVNTYEALLDYYMQGAVDPDRDRVYQQLVGHALLIGDRFAIARYGSKELPYYTSQHKTVRNESFCVYRQQLESFADGIKEINDIGQLKSLAAMHDKHLTALFTDLWTQSVWNATMAADADKFLLSSIITVEDQCTIVSAVTLNLLRTFDPLKMLFLCDAYYHPQATVSMRALVGIVIVCYCWASRISWYGEVEARLSLLSEDPIFSNQVCEVVLQFIRSTNTEQIDRKMREEIIPGLMKNPKLRQMPGVMKDEQGFDDINPDWEQWMHESGLEESMREISEWQMEGVDVNMSTFAQLKRYPFFYTIMNWFRPFDLWQSDVLDIVGNPNGADNPLTSTVLQSNFMCDSDKYSFCYAMREIPQVQRNVMLMQLEEQNKALKENVDIPDLNRLSKQTTKGVIRQYVQNLYRFFKLFPNIQEFDNPFEYVVSCPQRMNPLYHNIMEADSLFKLIDLNIKQKDYLRAIDFFECLNEWHPDCMEAIQLQQLGLCNQKLDFYEEAIEAYTKADLLQPNSYWTIVHLAQCYRANEQNIKALEYYEMAENIKPENLNIAFNIAELHYSLGNYEDAFPYLYKIDYHHPNTFKIVRLLAECSLFCCKFVQAAKYYERMMAEHADKIIVKDWKNIAYNSLLMGNRYQFFSYLQRAEQCHAEIPHEVVDMDGQLYSDKSLFVEEVQSDFPLLHSLGISTDQLNYLYDAYCKYKNS